MRFLKILLFLSVLVIALSCKREKNDLTEIDLEIEEQEVNPFTKFGGSYIGNLRHQGTFYKTDFARYDSLTGEPIGNDMIIIDTSMVDTIFIDTVEVEIRKDTIVFYSFNGINDFIVNEENKYTENYPGYTSTTFSINGDTLEIFDTYLINRGA